MRKLYEESEIIEARRGSMHRVMTLVVRQLVVLAAAVAVYAAIVGLLYGENPLDVSAPLQSSYAVILGLIWIVSAFVVFLLPTHRGSLHMGPADGVAGAEASPDAASPVAASASAPIPEMPHEEIAAPWPIDLEPHEDILSDFECRAEEARLDGRLFEAYYWLSLADIHGRAGLEVSLKKLRKQLLTVGFPEDEAMYAEDFGPQECAFAHAVLDADVGFARQAALGFIRTLAAEGDVDAAMYCARRLKQPGAYGGPRP